MYIHIYIHMHESTCESVINSGRYGWYMPHTITHSSFFFFLSTTWLSSVSCRVSQNRTAPLCMVESKELFFLHIHTATHCNTLQHVASDCNALQHMTHCNTWQTATRCMVERDKSMRKRALASWAKEPFHSEQKSPFILIKRAHISRQEEPYVFCNRPDISKEPITQKSRHLKRADIAKEPISHAGIEAWTLRVTVPKSAVYTRNMKQMNKEYETDEWAQDLARKSILCRAWWHVLCRASLSRRRVMSALKTFRRSTHINTYKCALFEASKSAKICLKTVVFVAFQLHSDCGCLIACGQWKHNTIATPESADYSKCNVKEPCVTSKRALISCKRALRLLQKSLNPTTVPCSFCQKSVQIVKGPNTFLKSAQIPQKSPGNKHECATPVLSHTSTSHLHIRPRHQTSDLDITPRYHPLHPREGRISFLTNLLVLILFNLLSFDFSGPVCVRALSSAQGSPPRKPPKKGLRKRRITKSENYKDKTNRLLKKSNRLLPETNIKWRICRTQR